MQRSTMKSILVYLVTIQLVCQGIQFQASAIVIDGPEERIMNVSTDFMLVCHGNDTLSWRYPNALEAKNSMTEKTTSEGVTSLLFVSSPSHLATGFYECFNDNESAAVYVYVFDKENLLAVNPDETLLMGHQYQNVTVPCKPTSPDVIITLNYQDRTVIIDKYDPKIGFTITNATLSDSGYIICEASKDGVNQSADFILSINPRSEIAPKPEIDDVNLQHVVVGQDLSIYCFVKVELGVTFSVEWTLPDHVSSSDRFTIGEIVRHPHLDDARDVTTWEKSVRIKTVKKEDEGYYTCAVRDHSDNVNYDTKFLRIYSKDENFINITVQSRRIEVDADSVEPARWIATIQAHPNADISWFNPDNEEISRTVSDKYQIRERGAQKILEIFNVDLSDAGNYTLVASNHGGKKAETLQLVVSGKPIVSLTSRNYYKINRYANITCYINGYPTPQVLWYFKRCQFLHVRDCSVMDNDTLPVRNILQLQVDQSHIVTTAQLNMMQPGILTCEAENEKGKTTASVPIRVTRIPEVFLLEKSTETFVEGDDVSLNCSVTSYEYYSFPAWYLFKDGKKTPSDMGKSSSIEQESKDYAYTATLRLNNITSSASGEYLCRAFKRPTHKEKTEQSVKINVLKVEPPEIYDTNLPNGELEISRWQPITWKCYARGVPQPTVMWYIDGRPLGEAEEMPTYELEDNNQLFSIKSLTLEGEGKYTCRASNKAGVKEAFVNLLLEENHKMNKTLVVIVVVVGFLLGLVLFLFFYALWKIWKEKDDFRRAGLENFQAGMPKSINQELTVDQQADLLPYDPKWEFPRHKLLLGKQLGAGAFGVVLKAEALGIVENEERTVVAVKMVKRHADPTYIKALVSELKILSHLGKHLNVVNLLGACTENYMNRELLVIVEFCRFGNAHNFLLSQRHKFIDQIDRETDEINPAVGRYVSADASFSVDSDAGSAGTSLNTEMTCVSSGRSDNRSRATNPLWCANLQGDYKKNHLGSLTTSTLVSWAFQVARGMEYLASRKVLHGDLAARNVLIAENNVVKICDFGFAKNIYNNPEYQKSGDGPVPVKWMAIESITRRIFSTQSDVWSYGIVLWEFFSLAKTPYPGFENFEIILKRLEEGYRMEKPSFANQKLYDIMLACWDRQPCRRPSFSELVMKLGLLMENNVRDLYVKLNEPYRNQAIPPGEDYLSMMSPPSYDDPSAQYANASSETASANDDGYLDMSNRSSWAASLPRSDIPQDSLEMRPMLPRQAVNEEEDYLKPRETPAHSSRSAFNPSYMMSDNANAKGHANYGKIQKPA